MDRVACLFAMGPRGLEDLPLFPIAHQSSDLASPGGKRLRGIGDGNSVRRVLPLGPASFDPKWKVASITSLNCLASRAKLCSRTRSISLSRSRPTSIFRHRSLTIQMIELECFMSGSLCLQAIQSCIASLSRVGCRDLAEQHCDGCHDPGEAQRTDEKETLFLQPNPPSRHRFVTSQLHLFS